MADSSKRRDPAPGPRPKRDVDCLTVYDHHRRLQRIVHHYKKQFQGHASNLYRKIKILESLRSHDVDVLEARNRLVGARQSDIDPATLVRVTEAAGAVYTTTQEFSKLVFTTREWLLYLKNLLKEIIDMGMGDTYLPLGATDRFFIANVPPAGMLKTVGDPPGPPNGVTGAFMYMPTGEGNKALVYIETVTTGGEYYLTHRDSGIHVRLFPGAFDTSNWDPRQRMSDSDARRRFTKGCFTSYGSRGDAPERTGPEIIVISSDDDDEDDNFRTGRGSVTVVESPGPPLASSTPVVPSSVSLYDPANDDDLGFEGPVDYLRMPSSSSTATPDVDAPYEDEDEDEEDEDDDDDPDDGDPDDGDPKPDDDDGGGGAAGASLRGPTAATEESSHAPATPVDPFGHFPDPYAVRHGAPKSGWYAAPDDPKPPSHVAPPVSEGAAVTPPRTSTGHAHAPDAPRKPHAEPSRRRRPLPAGEHSSAAAAAAAALMQSSSFRDKLQHRRRLLESRLSVADSSPPPPPPPQSTVLDLSPAGSSSHRRRPPSPGPASSGVAVDESPRKRTKKTGPPPSESPPPGLVDISTEAPPAGGAADALTWADVQNLQGLSMPPSAAAAGPPARPTVSGLQLGSAMVMPDPAGLRSMINDFFKPHDEASRDAAAEGDDEPAADPDDEIARRDRHLAALRARFSDLTQQFEALRTRRTVGAEHSDERDRFNAAADRSFDRRIENTYLQELTQLGEAIARVTAEQEEALSARVRDLELSRVSPHDPLVPRSSSSPPRIETTRQPSRPDPAAAAAAQGPASSRTQSAPPRDAEYERRRRAIDRAERVERAQLMAVHRQLMAGRHMRPADAHRNMQAMRTRYAAQRAENDGAHARFLARWDRHNARFDADAAANEMRQETYRRTAETYNRGGVRGRGRDRRPSSRQVRVSAGTDDAPPPVEEAVPRRSSPSPPPPPRDDALLQHHGQQRGRPTDAVLRHHGQHHERAAEAGPSAPATARDDDSFRAEPVVEPRPAPVHPHRHASPGAPGDASSHRRRRRHSSSDDERAGGKRAASSDTAAPDSASRKRSHAIGSGGGGASSPAETKHPRRTDEPATERGGDDDDGSSSSSSSSSSGSSSDGDDAASEVTKAFVVVSDESVSGSDVSYVASGDGASDGSDSDSGDDFVPAVPPVPASSRHPRGRGSSERRGVGPRVRGGRGSWITRPDGSRHRVTGDARRRAADEDEGEGEEAGPSRRGRPPTASKRHGGPAPVDVDGVRVAFPPHYHGGFVDKDTIRGPRRTEHAAHQPIVEFRDPSGAGRGRGKRMDRTVSGRQSTAGVLPYPGAVAGNGIDVDDLPAMVYLPRQPALSYAMTWGFLKIMGPLNDLTNFTYHWIRGYSVYTYSVSTTITANTTQTQRDNHAVEQHRIDSAAGRDVPAEPPLGQAATRSRVLFRDVMTPYPATFKRLVDQAVAFHQYHPMFGFYTYVLRDFVFY